MKTGLRLLHNFLNVFNKNASCSVLKQCVNVSYLSVLQKSCKIRDGYVVSLFMYHSITPTGMFKLVEINLMRSFSR